MEVHVGTSGYSYDDWVGRFYPKKMRREEWLSYYATQFDTVELNVTFYRIPNKQTFAGWYKKTPADFHFVTKGSRFITHIKRLKDAEKSLKIFFDAALLLKEKLKVVLWQLPPKFPADVKRLERFLRLLRTDIRHAFEFRDQSWLTERVYKLLREHNAALVFSDHPFEITKPATAGFVYVRRHGPGGAYHVAYPNRDLKKDADLIRRYHLPTYEFFNNDTQAAAAKNAQELRELLSVG